MTQEPAFKISVDEPQDGQTPLVRFRGTLQSHRTNVRHIEGRDKPALSVIFDFVDVTVIESTEPYPFPIASIPVPYSDRGQTQWAALTKSFRSLVPREAWEGLDDPLTLLDGKTVEMHRTHARLRLPVRDEDGNNTGQWAEQDGNAWQFVSIEGFGSRDGDGSGGQTIMDLILDYADGKTDQEIYQWVYTNQDLKGLAGYGEAVESIAERKLLTTLLAANQLTQDAEGKYHKVAG